MALSVEGAYAQIKALEDNGVLALPEPQDTVTIGVVDPAAGTFTWSVPTEVQTVVFPPTPPRKTNDILSVDVGVVRTAAVDLRLRFDVIAQPGRVSFETRQAVRMRDTATPNPPTASVVSARTLPFAGTLPIVGSGLFGETNGGVTIGGFALVESAADHITVDAGLVCSKSFDSRTTTPALTRFALTIDIPGHQQIQVQLFILRPPVVGIGVFTIPALPMTIVYAPPQGALHRNTATYADTQVVSRTVTTSISQDTSVKTVQAYSASDLIGKVEGAIATVAAVVAARIAPAGDVSSPATTGAVTSPSVVTARTVAALAAPDDQDDTVTQALQAIQSGLNSVKTILDAVDDPIGNMQQAVAVEDDSTLSLTVTQLSQYGSFDGLGPGVGDRIVYLSDVKVVWMAVDGEVGIHVLGAKTIGANAVADLLQEKARLEAKIPATLHLDIPTIDALLSNDVIVAPRKRAIDAIAPRIAPPRFEPASPPGRTGTGTSGDGDVFAASYDVGTGQKHVTTSSSTTITDNKPSWAAVLFGTDNIDTTTTATFVTTQTTDDTATDKTSTTITMVSTGLDDPYDISLFYDNLFGTYCVVDSDSPLLHGIGTVDVGPARLDITR